MWDVTRCWPAFWVPQCSGILKPKCHNGRTTDPFCSIWRWSSSALELPIWFYYLLRLLQNYPGYIIMSNKGNYLMMDEEIIFQGTFFQLLDQWLLKTDTQTRLEREMQKKEKRKQAGIRYREATRKEGGLFNCSLGMAPQGPFSEKEQWIRNDTKTVPGPWKSGRLTVSTLCWGKNPHSLNLALLD